MKQKKRRIEFFSFYDHTGIEAHLSEMARKGWLIESVTNYFWTYRRTEPKNVHFCVTYYPKASDFDPGPSDQQQTFLDFCAHTGWKFKCSFHQMQVFYNEMESPLPLDTDPVIEVDILHQALKKNFLPSYFLMLCLGLFMTVYFIAGIYFDPIGLLSSSSRLVSQFACMCLLAISAVELLTYFSWHRKAAKAAQDGIFMDTPSTTGFQIFILILLMIGMIWWFVSLMTADDPFLLWVAVIMFVYIFGVVWIVNGIKQGLKKAKVSRGMNKAVTLAACFILPTIMSGMILAIGFSLSRSETIRGIQDVDTSPPLSLSDFTEIEEDSYVQQDRNNQTFLVGQRVVNMYPHWDIQGFYEMPDLHYTITTVKIPFLYEWCKSQMYWNMDERRDKDIPEGHRNILIEQDPANWGAKAAYRLYQEEGWWQNRYLLCYEDKIVDIRFDWEPQEEEMAIAGKKLNA